MLKLSLENTTERGIIMVLSCNNINKSFGTNNILTNISFHINEYEKAAVIGVNGAGKSTLLKIMIEELKADSGEIITAKGSTIGYLAQHQDLDSSKSIYDEMLEVKKDIIALEEQIHQLELAMKQVTGSELENMLSNYTRFTHEYEMKNGYSYKSEIIGVLKGLGFSENDFHKTIDTLSGGQRTRVSLGKLLLSSPNILLLDEPTNHLDMDSIAWLENYLLNYKGSMILVAHDRYFLDKIVTKIIEIEYGKATSYEGNYSQYAEKKARLQDAQIKQYLNQQKEIKHQEEVITKLRSFNREKSIKRAESREKLLNKIERLEKPITRESQIALRLEPHIMSGNDVLTVTNLCKSFEDLTLFTNLSFQIKRGETVAIIGNNGTGKTTILKIINQFILQDSGEIKLGAKVKIGYYDQEHQTLNLDKSIFEELQDTYPHLDNTSIRNILAAFLFTNDDVFKRIQDLSGGERGRVSLAKLMLSEANLLILDEPTNHLDIMSKEILENAIRNYTGTVLYVSHDRYFINKTATRILDLTHQTLLNYIGNYDYYLEKKEEVERVYLESGAIPSIHLIKEDTNSGMLDWKQQKEEQARIRKRENDLRKTEEQIHQLESREEEIHQLLTQEEIYTNVERLIELNEEKKSLENKLEQLYEVWDSLASQS